MEIHSVMHGPVDAPLGWRALMRRPQLIEIEFFLLAALSLPPMLWGIGKAIGALTGLW